MDLFGEPSPDKAPPEAAPRRPRKAEVAAAAPDPDNVRLASQLSKQLHLGTSSWSFPGWAGLVWAGEHGESSLARKGLAAYGQHPLLRTVSLDRGFYQPLTASQYAAYAAQVPDGFRFVVKAASLVADAMVRGKDGQGLQPNPSFLSPALAVQEFVQPALEGLADKTGALVFQLSPLPASWLARMPEVLERLAAMLAALPPLRPAAPDGVIAVEVRNPEFLTPAFAAVLKNAGATYCLGLHAKMPPIEDQLPLLRALWPAPLVCRWSLHRKHGSYGYEGAKGLYEPFDKLVDPDLATRNALARVIAGTVGAGMNAYVTVNNKAEGCAPLSVAELAKAVLESTRA
ncbi:MAG: DUF72 domain-containing protein [Burkholderiales bacterium]|nr:DUF72 domain-containing protein [Burkholderiales bacterium]